MTHPTQLSLLENFSHFTALLAAGKLTEEEARRFQRDIKVQITSAETLARATPMTKADMFEHAQVIMGYRPDAVLAFPKPQPLPRAEIRQTLFVEA